MPEPVEVAIQSALVSRAQAFAAAQSPAIPIALPNVEFEGMPAQAVTAKWLRVSFLPADTFALGISYDSKNQHFGFLQLDVFYGQSSGEYAAARIASAAIAYFKRGTTVTKDGFRASVVATPHRGPMLKDDPWIMIPVRIPYLCFAPNPA